MCTSVFWNKGNNDGTICVGKTAAFVGQQVFSQEQDFY